MLDMDSDDEAALMEMCSSDSSESSDHTSDESDHAERSTSEAVFCVVSSTAEKLIALWKYTWKQSVCFAWELTWNATDAAHCASELLEHLKKKSNPKSPGEKHKKKRPDVAWFTVTMRPGATGRPDVDAARIDLRAADKPKTSGSV